MKTRIVRDGKHYMVSTVDTWDAGWETMVFPCTPDGDVTDYGELACQRYYGEEDATNGHAQMVLDFQP